MFTFFHRQSSLNDKLPPDWLSIIYNIQTLEKMVRNRSDIGLYYSALTI